MPEHRNPRKRLPKQPTPDNRRPALPPPTPSSALDGLMYILRDNLRRADAFVTSAEELIERSWGDEGDEDDDEEGEDGGIQRRRMRVEYLVEGGKEAVRAALYTTQEIDAELTRRRIA